MNTVTETIEKTTITFIKEMIAHNNPAMLECLDILTLGESVYALGHTSDGYFATWQINTADHSSFWGHYGLTTRDNARRDLFKRASLPLGSLDQLI